MDGANASGESETLTWLGYIKAVSLEAAPEVNVTGSAPAETGPTMSGNVKERNERDAPPRFENNRTEDVAARDRFLTTRPRVTFNQLFLTCTYTLTGWKSQPFRKFGFSSLLASLLFVICILSGSYSSLPS
jgi:hypothetical protein